MRKKAVVQVRVLAAVAAANEKKVFSFNAAMKYAFVTLLGDIAKPLFWGLAFGSTHNGCHS